MVADRETTQFSCQYSPISATIGRDEDAGGDDEQTAMLDNSETKSAAPVVVTCAAQPPTTISAEDQQQQKKKKSNKSRPKADDDDQQLPLEPKVYRRRWIMLAIFVLVFMTNAFQWIQFSIINNLVTK